jgi:hypothetical protein
MQARQGGGLRRGTHPLLADPDCVVCGLLAHIPASAQERVGPTERRLLATMLLHAITAVLGERGLRERLGSHQGLTASWPMGSHAVAYPLVACQR